MKNKLMLLAISLCGFFAANATDGPDENYIPGGEKKSDILGVVLHSENKKPIKEVSITAYSVSKKEKEKTIQTDDSGNYSFEDLKPGTYKFVFEKNGFRKVTREKVVIKTNEAFQLNIEMIESRELDIIPSPLLFTDF